MLSTSKKHPAHFVNDEKSARNSFDVRRWWKVERTKEKAKKRILFLLTCLRFIIVNFYIATEQAKYILCKTENEKSEHNFSVGILILFTLINWRETWMPENAWREKKIHSLAFSFKNGFRLLKTWSLSRKSGPGKEWRRKKKSRETDEKCAFFMKDGIIWNIWQNSRPFTWMNLHKAPIFPD